MMAEYWSSLDEDGWVEGCIYWRRKILTSLRRRCSWIELAETDPVVIAIESVDQEVRKQKKECGTTTTNNNNNSTNNQDQGRGYAARVK